LKVESLLKRNVNALSLFEILAIIALMVV